MGRPTIGTTYLPAKEPGRSEGEVEILIASAGASRAGSRELAAMRPDLLRLRDQQRDARNRTLDVASQPDGSLIPADRDRLLGVQHLQDQIGGKITDRATAWRRRPKRSVRLSRQQLARFERHRTGHSRRR